MGLFKNIMAKFQSVVKSEKVRAFACSSRFGKARRPARLVSRCGRRHRSRPLHRIRSGLLTPDMIRSRAASRGVGEVDYMAGNLLRREVTAEDVAQAFLHHALALKTTGDVTTVDGGNINAILR